MKIARRQCNPVNDTADAETAPECWFARGQRLGKPILFKNAALDWPTMRFGPRPTNHQSPFTFHLTPLPQLRFLLPFDICPK
jgi:hypothetical protein